MSEKEGKWVVTEDGPAPPHVSELIDGVESGKLIARIVNKGERIQRLRKLNVNRL